MTFTLYPPCSSSPHSISLSPVLWLFARSIPFFLLRLPPALGLVVTKIPEFSSLGLLLSAFALSPPSLRSNALIRDLLNRAFWPLQKHVIAGAKMDHWLLFAVQYDARANTGIDRMKIRDAVARTNKLDISYAHALNWISRKFSTLNKIVQLAPYLRFVLEELVDCVVGSAGSILILKASS